MKTIPIPHALLALGFAALAVAAAIFVPTAMIDKLATLLERIAADPAGATVIVSVIAGAVTTLRAAWVRRPPGDGPPPAPPSDGPPTRPRRASRLDAMRVALALGLGLLLPGCGASALRAHSTAATIASIAVGDLDVRTAQACDAVIVGCAGETACVAEAARRCRVAGQVGDAVVASVRAYVDAVEVAAHADEGAVLPALLAAWRGIRDLWPAIVAALEGLGVTVPALPLLGGGS